MPAKFTAVMDAAQIEREYRKLQKQNVRLTDKMTRMADASDRAGGAFRRKQTTMDKLKASVGTVAASYVGMQGVLSGVRSALAFVRGETEKAMQSNEGLADSNRRLAQISTSSSDLSEMERRADELSARYGEDRSMVRRVIFSGRSENFSQSVEDLIKYDEVVSAEAAARVAGQVPGLFKGSGLRPMEAVSGTLVAAEASRLDFSQIAEAMPMISAGGAIAKGDPAEALGVLSVLAGRFKSGLQASERMSTFATKLGISEEFGGRGIVGGMEALMGADEETRKGFLGESKELNEAFIILKEELPEVRERIQMINNEFTRMRAGGPSTLEMKRRAYFDTGTEEGRARWALEEAQKSRIRKEVANERDVADAYLREAAKNNTLAQMDADGTLKLSQYPAAIAGAAAETLQVSPETVGKITGAYAEGYESSSALELAAHATPYGIYKGFKAGYNLAFGSDDEEDAGGSDVAEDIRRIAENTEGTPVGSSTAAAAAIVGAQRQGR